MLVAIHSALGQNSQRDGVVVRASASQSTDLRFIPLVESYQKTLKNGINSFPAWLSARRDSAENKPASLLVVSLSKVLNGIPHLHVADRWRGQAVYPSWWSSLTKDMQTHRHKKKAEIQNASQKHSSKSSGYST